MDDRSLEQETISMWKGRVLLICVAPSAEVPMVSLNEARAVAGKGLEGDRYFKQGGTFSDKPGPALEMTLIEMEAIQALKQEEEIDLNPLDSRRNIVTEGVPLNHLVGKEFRIGEVLLRGIRLCEPCAHLARLTDQRILTALAHRGGLRAQILTDGLIRTGELIEGIDPEGEKP